jgi:hypothetical protein
MFQKIINDDIYKPFFEIPNKIKAKNRIAKTNQSNVTYDRVEHKFKTRRSMISRFL